MAFLAVLVFGMSLAGCGKGKLIAPTPLTEESSDSEASGEETPSLSAQAEAVRKVYLLLPSEEAYSHVEAEILTKAVREAGAESIILNYGGDPETQTAYFKEAAENGAALIIADNADSDETYRSVMEAKEAGIPVFLMGRGIDTMGAAAYQVLTENFSCASELGRAFAEYKEGTCQYVTFLGTDSAEDVLEAFTASLAGKSGMQLAGRAQADENDAHASYEAIWNVLYAAPEADAVICVTPEQTEAAVNAAGDLGRSVTCVCLDGNDDRIEGYLADGRVQMACVKPAEELARTCADAVSDYLAEGVLPDSECIFVRGTIRVTEAGTDTETEAETDAA